MELNQENKKKIFVSWIEEQDPYSKNIKNRNIDKTIDFIENSLNINLSQEHI